MVLWCQRDRRRAADSVRCRGRPQPSRQSMSWSARASTDGWDRQAECCGRPAIDDELEGSRVAPLRMRSTWAGRLAKHRADIGSVRHQAAVLDVLVEFVHRRQPMSCRQFDQSAALTVEERRRKHVDRAGALPPRRAERRLEVGGAGGLERQGSEAELPGGTLSAGEHGPGDLRPMQDCHPRHGWHGLLQELELFGDQKVEFRGDAREVAAGTGETRDEPGGDRRRARYTNTTGTVAVCARAARSAADPETKITSL